MDTQTLEYLDKKLENIKQSYSTALGEGGAKDFGEYQNMCGAIRGLALAQREIADLVRRVKEHEDE